MADDLHVHVIMKNGIVLKFTMHKDEAARFAEELARDGYNSEPIESVRIGGVDEGPSSENWREAAWRAGGLVKL